MNFAIKVLPQINAFSFGDEQIYLDETVTATCTITKGDLPIKSWWSLSDMHQSIERNLTTNDGVMITQNSQKISVLAIEAVKARHRGNYTCYAQNKAGIAQFSASLAINGDYFNILFIISFLFCEFCNSILQSCHKYFHSILVRIKSIWMKR